MKKQAIFIGLLIAVFIIAFLAGILSNNNEKQDIGTANILDEPQNEITRNEILQTSATAEKTTPNTVLVLEKYYTVCDHTISNIVAIPEDMINLSKEEIVKNYPDWEVETFSKDEIVLYKEIDDFCDEHYILKEENGQINIYKIDSEGKETLKEKTELSVEYLTETDKITLKSGIMVYGKEELNKIIEDFE